MHLSIHSDCFLSDILEEPGFHRAPPAKRHAHRDGLVRGLAIVAVAGILVGLTFLSQGAQPAEAEPAPHFSRQMRGYTHFTGSAVNMMHREVTRL